MKKRPPRRGGGAAGRGTGREPESFVDRRFALLGGAIVVLALGLRLLRLGHQELWLDEAGSVFLAGAPDVLSQMLADNTGPMYYLLLRGWMALAGQSEAMVRLPSALAGTAFVGTAIWLGRTIFDVRVALWSGVIAATAPIHIYYSQEARAYALLTFLLALSVGALWRAFETNAWRWWVTATATIALALYTHYFAVLGLLPTAFLLVMWRERARWVRYAGSVLAGGAAFLPWAALSGLARKPQSGGFSWLRPVWEQMSPLLAIPTSLEVFALGSQRGLLPIQLKQFSLLEYSQALRWLGIAAFAIVGLWAVLPAADPPLGDPSIRWRKGWLVIWLLLPLATLLGLSFLAPFYVVGRYDLVAFPAVSLLIGLGLGKGQRLPRAGPALAALAAVALLIPVGIKLRLYYEAPPAGLVRGVARALDEAVQAGDVVVFTGGRLVAQPVLYYLGRLGYREAEGVCRQESTGRQFPCQVRAAAVPASAPVPAPTPRGRLWVFFGSGVVQGRRLILRDWDSDLARELTRAGFRSEPVDGAPHLVRFSRL